MSQNTIYFDNIIFSLQRTGGISIVWYELLKRFLPSPWMKHIHFLEYNGAEANPFRQCLDLPHDKITHRDYRFLPIQRYINPRIRQREKFIFHSSYYRTCANPNAINVTTVHDFTYEHFIHGIKKKVHCHQKHRAIRRSDHIICISEHTKRDLLRFLPEIEPERISVIYNGVSDDYCVLPEHQPTDLPFPRGTYIIYIGSRAVYKNFPLAVKSLKGTDWNLVVVGNPLTADETDLLETHLPGRYICTGHIGNQRLNQLYNNAFCLLYPSSYEGFGIPVLEAQKAGCPVIATHSSSIPEIISDTSMLLDHLTTDDVRDRLARLLNKGLRTDVVRKGLENARRFTWDNTFDQVRELYARLLNTP